MGRLQKYSAPLVAATIALLWAVIHFYSGWEAAIDEAHTHGEVAIFSDYVVQWIRDTAENLQSEFWQLAFQFTILAGAFKKIKAHEEDMEELKNMVKKLEYSVAQLLNK